MSNTVTIQQMQITVEEYIFNKKNVKVKLDIEHKYKNLRSQGYPLLMWQNEFIAQVQALVNCYNIAKTYLDNLKS